MIGLIALAAGITIAIGSRLSEQTVAALAGAACGIGVAGPAGFGLGLYVGSMRTRARSAAASPPAPQVIVMPAQPAQMYQAPGSTPYMPAPRPAMPPPRSFTIIGDEE
jgi:hypothetical protein